MGRALENHRVQTSGTANGSCSDPPRAWRSEASKQWLEAGEGVLCGEAWTGTRALLTDRKVGGEIPILTSLSSFSYGPLELPEQTHQEAQQCNP